MAMKPRAMKKKPMRGGGMMPRKMKRGGETSDPAWLKAMKKEAERLGIPLRELLTKATKPASKEKKTMKAKRGGMAKKPMMRGGMAKKK
tara:strand:- start:36 stop:302 length:267 start_codon:yes stop_codon:yes gene_type:complete